MNDTTNTTEIAGTNETQTKPHSKSAIRAAILGMKAKSELVTLFGAEVEVRQPSLGVIMDSRERMFSGETDLKSQTVDMIIRYVFVPGTNEKVFDEADRDELIQLPFSNDINKLSTTLNRIMGVDASEVKEALDESTKSTEG